jgi:hypothetical protein
MEGSRARRDLGEVVVIADGAHGPTDRLVDRTVGRASDPQGRPDRGRQQGADADLATGRCLDDLELAVGRKRL